MRTTGLKKMPNSNVGSANKKRPIKWYELKLTLGSGCDAAETGLSSHIALTMRR